MATRIRNPHSATPVASTSSASTSTIAGLSGAVGASASTSSFPLPPSHPSPHHRDLPYPIPSSSSRAPDRRPPVASTSTASDSRASPADVIDLTASSSPPPPHSRFPHLSFPSSSLASTSNVTSHGTRTRDRARVVPGTREGAGGRQSIGTSQHPILNLTDDDDDDDDLVIVSERPAARPLFRMNRPASPPPFIVPPNYPAMTTTTSIPNPSRPRLRARLRSSTTTTNGVNAVTEEEEGDVESRRLAEQLAQEELGGIVVEPSSSNGGRVISGSRAALQLQAQAMRQATTNGNGRTASYGGYILHRPQNSTGNGNGGGRRNQTEADPFDRLLTMPPPNHVPYNTRGGGGERGGGRIWGTGSYMEAMFASGAEYRTRLFNGENVTYAEVMAGYPALRGLYNHELFDGVAPQPATGGWGGAAKVRAANKKYGVKMSHPLPIQRGFSRDIIEPIAANDADPETREAGSPPTKRLKKYKAKEKDDIEIQEMEPVCASCLGRLQLGSEDKDGKVWALHCGHVVCGKCLREAKTRCEDILEKERGGWVMNVDLDDDDSVKVGGVDEVMASPKKGKGQKRGIVMEGGGTVPIIDGPDPDDDKSRKPDRVETRSGKTKKGKGKSKSAQDQTGVEEDWTTCPVSTCAGQGNDLLAEKGWSRPFELYA